jgi:hypothetical protein
MAGLLQCRVPGLLPWNIENGEEKTTRKKRGERRTSRDRLPQATSKFLFRFMFVPLSWSAFNF